MCSDGILNALLNLLDSLVDICFCVYCLWHIGIDAGLYLFAEGFSFGSAVLVLFAGRGRGL